MKRNLLFVYLFLAVVGIAGFAAAIFNTLQKQNQPALPAEQVPTTTPTRNEQVNIYLVALEDNGVSGEKIGCNDSLVPVKQDVTVTDSLSHAALKQLLSLQSQTYGESGLYNSLYQSELHIDSLTVENGVAVVYLTGMVQLGGVCDNPRFQEQINATLTQFPEVNSTDIYINGVHIQDALSGQ